MRTAHTLNSGMRLVGSSAGLVSRLIEPAPPQWNGTNTVSSRMSRVTPRAGDRGAAARHQRHERTVHHAGAPRRDGIDLDQRLGRELHEPLDAPRLRPRLVLREDAPRREEERILGVRLFRRRLVAHGMEARTPARRGEALGEQARRSLVLG